MRWVLRTVCAIVGGAAVLLLPASVHAGVSAPSSPSPPAPSGTDTRPHVQLTSPGPAERARLAAPEVLARLDRAVEASAAASLRGRLTVASVGAGGPQVTTVEVARRPDGRLRATRKGSWELGRDEDGGYLHSDRTGRLLELGGVQARSFDRERFHERYHVAEVGARQLDTGPAVAVQITDRNSGALREVVYLDEATGLIVRRETRDGDGELSRVVAFTELEVDDDVGARPSSREGLEAERVALDPVDQRELAERGIPAVTELPGGFTLLDTAEVRGTSTPAVHLVYGDGLYTLSVYVQRGQLAPRAVRHATRLQLHDGDGAVWRWPGSEPRRVVWPGDGRTFTAVTDAPTGVLLAAIAGLPNDPPPSTLDRLARGFSRAADRLRTAITGDEPAAAPVDTPSPEPLTRTAGPPAAPPEPRIPSRGLRPR